MTVDICQEAVLVGLDGTEVACLSTGISDGRQYLAFPFVAPSPSYTLRRGDNSPVELLP